MLKVAMWTALACLAAVIAFLVATVRIVDPAPADPVAPVMAPGQMPGQRPGVSSVARNPALAVPVAGVDRAALTSHWGDARGDGDGDGGGARAHEGLDIMAPGGTPVLAVADGVVEKLYFSEGGGGVSLYQRSADGGWVYYYAHLAGYAPGVVEGRRVARGDTIGYVGDTGNAGAGNHHLHFGVSMMRAGERWHEGKPVDPYPLLAGTRSSR